MRKKKNKKLKTQEFVKKENFQEEENQEDLISLNDTLSLLLEMGSTTNNNVQIIAECIATIQNDLIKIKEENNELKKLLGIGVDNNG